MQKSVYFSGYQMSEMASFVAELTKQEIEWVANEVVSGGWFIVITGF